MIQTSDIRKCSMMLGFCLAFVLGGQVTAQAADTTPQASDTVDKAALAGEARSITKSFAMGLKSELIGAMKSGGPVKAMGVCNLKAQDITADASDKSGWRVARTSAKLRNPANAADDWELKVLEGFEKQMAAGADPKSLEFFEIATYDEQKSFRYMKAIPVGGPCVSWRSECEA